jgi:hypothetical protein
LPPGDAAVILVGVARKPGSGDGPAESVLLYLVAQDSVVEPLWRAWAALFGCGIATGAPFHYWWGWPGVAAAAVTSASAAALVFWLTCRGPRSCEVSPARLRFLDLRGRVCDQFDRGDVEAVELSSRLLTVIEPARRRHAIAVDNVMMPRAVSRLRNALRRHGWLPPDPSLTSWPESSVILRLVLIAATSA